MKIDFICIEIALFLDTAVALIFELSFKYKKRYWIIRNILTKKLIKVALKSEDLIVLAFLKNEMLLNFMKGSKSYFVYMNYIKSFACKRCAVYTYFMCLR